MSTLKVGEGLAVDQALASPGGESRLVLRPDGRLVVYRGGSVPADEVWSTPSPPPEPAGRPVRAALNGKGELVLLTEVGLPVWSSRVQDNPPDRPDAHLEIQDDGRLLIREAPGGAELWSTAPDPSQTGSAVDFTDVVTAVKAGEVGWGKRMVTLATLYRNGLLVVDSTTMNDNWFAGLRGRTLVVVADADGKAIWVSSVFADATRCSIPDVSCASYGRMTHTEKFPDPVGEHAARLDVYHADGASFVDLRDALIDFIKAAADVIAEIQAFWGQLQKST
ncbi:hypothetical protein ACI78V_19310 [Geodermatophilus sp. SYSU D00742]